MNEDTHQHRVTQQLKCDDAMYSTWCAGRGGGSNPNAALTPAILGDRLDSEAASGECRCAVLPDLTESIKNSWACSIRRFSCAAISVAVALPLPIMIIEMTDG